MFHSVLRRVAAVLLVLGLSCQAIAAQRACTAPVPAPTLRKSAPSAGTVRKPAPTVARPASPSSAPSALKAPPAPKTPPAPKPSSTLPSNEVIAQERQNLDSIASTSFPQLKMHYEVLRPSTGNYNCIAWSLGITGQWVWPGSSLADFDMLNGKFGYKRISGLNYRLQPGVQKIVLYGKFVNGEFQATHQALQLRDGTWTSKLGKMALIRHARPDALNGPDYGQPIAVYYRRTS